MNTATLVKTSGKCVEYRESQGLYSCLLEHKVAETKASFEWKGPKISKDSWEEMLAFFKWTWLEEKSESQVRLFVHPIHGWKIWAFPQKGGTGMTTKEEDNDDFKRQRADIGDGYIPFGTVHHHCGAPAFQSSVDTEDEKNVDGIHITIGKIDDAKHDIHTRMYFKSCQFEINLASFWDIGEEMREKMKFVAELGFTTEELEHNCAIMQMTEPAPADRPFNEIWKANYLVRKFIDEGVWCCWCQAKVKDHKAEDCKKKFVTSSRGYGTHYPNTKSEREVVREAYREALRLHLSDEESYFTQLEQIAGGDIREFSELVMDACSDNFMRLKSFYNTYIELCIEDDNKDKGGAAKGAAAETIDDGEPTTMEEYYKGQGYF